MKPYLLLSFIFSILFSLAILQDTFSIVAVDPVTQEVGSAGASCIGGSIIISDVHPGVGVIHTQSWWNGVNQNNAEDLMDQGYSPYEIMEWLVENDAQGNPSIRQYGAVDLVDGGRSAAFTGENCMDYKNHITGPTYAIQGNILLGQEILDSMEVRFNNTPGSLASRLMSAMQGANVPGADSRCLDEGISSLSAFIRVAQPEDAENDLYLHLNVNNTPYPYEIDPIDSLQNLFDLWYADHPDYMLGDVNADGIINVQDIILIVNFILGNMEPTPVQFLAADMDGNILINVLDIIQVVNIILRDN